MTRHLVLLGLLAAALFFANLGAAQLWDVDEAIFSQSAREMMDRGDLVVPYFNGEVFPDKPPLMYWAMIAAYKVFGPSEFAARFWSAVFGVGTVLLTYALGRAIFSPRIGWWSALVLATSLNFNLISRAATPDSLLTFFVSLALLVLVWGTRSSAAAAWLSGVTTGLGSPESPSGASIIANPSWGTYALSYAVMGIAVLVKGPIGVVLPTAIWGLFLLCIRQPPVKAAPRSLGQVAWQSVQLLRPMYVLRTIWSMRPLTALVMVAAVAGPWYAAVASRTGGQWLVGFIGVHNVGRFLNAMDNHSGPPYYYLVAVAIGFFPWSVLVTPALFHLRRVTADRDPNRAGYMLVASWAAVWIGFFSLAGTKLPSYVVPAYPALAIVVGVLISHLIERRGAISALWMQIAWATMTLVGIALLLALPLVAGRYIPGEELLGLVGIVPLAGGIAGWFLWRKKNSLAALASIVATGALFCAAVLAIAVKRVDKHQNSEMFAARIRSLSAQPAIGSFNYARPSLVFYTQQHIEKFQTIAEIRQFFTEHPRDAFFFTTADQYPLIAAALPDDVQIIERSPRFLKAGEVLLLGRSDDTAAAVKTDRKTKRK